MENNFNLISVIMILGAVQGFFLTFFLIIKKKDEGMPSYILSALLFLASLLFLMAAFHQARKTEALIWLGPIVYPGFVAIGPIVYLYIKSIVEENFKLRIVDLLYFFPYFIGVAFLARIYFFPYQEQIQFIERFYQHEVNIFETIFRYFDIAYRGVFVILSIKLLTDYRENLKEEYSGLDKIDFRWLKQLLVYYFLTIIGMLIVTILNLDNDYRVGLAIYLSIIMYVIGYRFLSITTIQKPKFKHNENEKIKYEKSGLNDDVKNSIQTDLIKLIETEKVYTDPELSVAKLAEMLTVSSNQISQVINEKFNKNFYEFINGYRVEYAKELLVADDFKNESILSIAFEAGFQSKSTFNAVFKKINNTTPSQFRKSASPE